MANDQVRFRRALEKWDTLHDNERYSAPVKSGTVAILCSDRALGDEKGVTATQADIDSADQEREAFYTEACRIAETLRAGGVESKVFPAFTLEDTITVLEDPTFSSVVTIGNGNLSEIWAHQGLCISWDFIANHADHLKTGYFIQRQCGQVAYNLSVPLGTFALADHSNVFAALDAYLPTVLSSEHEALITQVHNEPRLGIEAVKRLFTLDRGI